MRSLTSIGTWFVVFCGALAGLLVGEVMPDGVRPDTLELRQVPYAADWSEDPFELHPAHWLDVPWQYADFDLQMDVELGEGVTLDVVTRRVEPRFVDEVMEPFHGRFTTLRLTADRDGEPWFSRERLLLGARDAAGAEVAPGYTASVWMRARGRVLEANVAGKRLPRFLAADEFGSFLFVARGGSAVIKSLLITPRGHGQAWLWSRWLWLGIGVLAGVVLRAAGLALGGGAMIPGLLLVLLTWVMARMYGRELEPMTFPEPGILLAMLGTALCAGMSAIDRLFRPMFVIAIVLVWLIEPARPDDSALDAVFGPDAGSTLVEAHAQQVRSGSVGGIHDVGEVDRRVFLLGGQLLYGLDADERHLELLLLGDLRVATQQRVDVPGLPTVDGYATQQWELFSRFFTGYRPDVIVFGVSSEEGAIDPATGEPRSYPSDLERALAKARGYCAANDADLVLFAGPGIDAGFLGVLQREAERGVPLVVAGADDRETQSRRLAAVIAPLLP